MLVSRTANIQDFMVTTSFRKIQGLSLKSDYTLFFRRKLVMPLVLHFFKNFGTRKIRKLGGL